MEVEAFWIGGNKAVVHDDANAWFRNLLRVLMRGEVWHLAVYASQDFISGQCRNIVLSERPNEGTCRSHELPLVIAPLFGLLLPRPWM
jgi:hypothetical protein